MKNNAPPNLYFEILNVSTLREENDAAQNILSAIELFDKQHNIPDSLLLTDTAMNNIRAAIAIFVIGEKLKDQPNIPQPNAPGKKNPKLEI